MSDYLRNIAARSLGRMETIVPRLASRYEPMAQAESLDLRDISGLKDTEWRKPDLQEKFSVIPHRSLNEFGAPVLANRRSRRHSVLSVFHSPLMRQAGLKGIGERMPSQQAGADIIDDTEASARLPAALAAAPLNSSKYDADLSAADRKESFHKANAKRLIRPSIFEQRQESVPVVGRNHPHWAADPRPQPTATIARDVSFLAPNRQPEGKAIDPDSEPVETVHSHVEIPAAIELHIDDQAIIFEEKFLYDGPGPKIRAKQRKISGTPSPPDEVGTNSFASQQTPDGSEMGQYFENMAAEPVGSKIAATAELSIDNHTALSEERLPVERPESKLKADADTAIKQRMHSHLEERSADKSMGIKMRTILESEPKIYPASNYREQPAEQPLHPNSPATELSFPAKVEVYNPKIGSHSLALDMFEENRQPPFPSEIAPEIQVTIGRIEVRATPPPVNSPRRMKPLPLLSLDEYLRQRSGGDGR